MSELKPCPVCCREPILSESNRWPEDRHVIGHTVMCDNIDCWMYHLDGWYELTAEDAVNRWNTRAERTCHIEWKPEVFAFVCDACDMIQMMAPNSNPNYCPNCGARVVQGD